MATPLSKMNKKQLYEECKKLKNENTELKESYKYGTLGKNGDHIELNKQGDMYYNHTTAMKMMELEKEITELKEEYETLLDKYLGLNTPLTNSSSNP